MKWFQSKQNTELLSFFQTLSWWDFIGNLPWLHGFLIWIWSVHQGQVEAHAYVCEAASGTFTWANCDTKTRRRWLFYYVLCEFVIGVFLYSCWTSCKRAHRPVINRKGRAKHAGYLVVYTDFLWHRCTKILSPVQPSLWVKLFGRSTRDSAVVSVLTAVWHLALVRVPTFKMKAQAQCLNYLLSQNDCFMSQPFLQLDNSCHEIGCQTFNT